MKRIILTLICCLLATGIFAQNSHFTTSGTILFDKTVNMYALIKKNWGGDETYMKQYLDEYKRNKPQFKVLKSSLTFTGNKTLFMPIENVNGDDDYYGGSSATKQNNIIYTNLTAKAFICQKTVYDDLFLVKDSTRKIKWKLTNETREIAGYTCRRANAVVLDSIYVVAFYTDKIAASGGPESFTGLPGMILGVALPHENVTWFATKVTDSPIPESAIAPPKKGKPVDNKGLVTTLTAALKSWGTYAQQAYKAFLL